LNYCKIKQLDEVVKLCVPLNGYPQISIEVGLRLGRTVVIDLTALQMLDEKSAVLLRRLNAHPSVSLSGCQLFIKQMIEASIDSQDAEALPPLTEQAKDKAKL